jgi:hypothetical protein
LETKKNMGLIFFFATKRKQPPLPGPWNEVERLSEVTAVSVDAVAAAGREEEERGGTSAEEEEEEEEEEVAEEEQAISEEEEAAAEVVERAGVPSVRVGSWETGAKS